MSNVKKSFSKGKTTTREQNVDAAPKSKEELLAWIKANWLPLSIIFGTCIFTVIATVYGLNHKDSIRAFWNNLNETIREANMYSPKWFETASVETLYTEREKIRLAWSSSGDYRLDNLLRVFDKEISKKKWGDETPHAPSIHREHGWYLPNDD
ncbi:MAG: hypothetical protein LIO70_04475 [Clostridiales bacterium]|nr:hypothetical protein [Clostridiales bacterium]